MTSVIPFYVCEVGKPRGNPYTRRLVFKYGVLPSTLRHNTTSSKKKRRCIIHHTTRTTTTTTTTDIRPRPIALRTMVHHLPTTTVRRPLSCAPLLTTALLTTALLTMALLTTALLTTALLTTALLLRDLIVIPVRTALPTTATAKSLTTYPWDSCLQVIM
ncbi:uncharacterized protein LOC132254659 [Vitis vinifera]|uniref:uncharacterized protein LOC132254659 n=1 Tax=Vitis vinifera TaxID=29760 RepID=UPI00023B33B5|nr:uncharacterized protein LOC132254659 [Vitis vinifera]